MVEHHPALNRPSEPLCSICIANYNGAGLLADCIASIRAQQTDACIEIIVHDDASSDASVEILINDYPDVELLASKMNVGFCVANNRMANIARGKYILLLNNDAALYPDAIQALLQQARTIGEQAILTLPQYDWESGTLVDYGCQLDPFYNPVPNKAPDKPEVAMTIGACMFLPRNLWRKLGGFPPWMRMSSLCPSAATDIAKVTALVAIALKTSD